MKTILMLIWILIAVLIISLFPLQDSQWSYREPHDIQRAFIIRETQDRLEVSNMLTILNMECGREDWFCMSKTKDCWPFQINVVHKDLYKRCLVKIKKWKKIELFKEQLKFALNWYRNLKKKYPKKNTKELAKLFFNRYNGSSRYAKKAIKLREIHKKNFKYLYYNNQKQKWMISKW